MDEENKIMILKTVGAGVLSFVEFVLVILSFFLPANFGKVIRFPADMELLEVEAALTAAGILCLIFAPSAWIYTSRFRWTRLCSQIITSIILLIVAIRLLIVGTTFNKKYEGTKVWKNFSRSIFTQKNYKALEDTEILCIIISSFLLLICLYLFIVSALKLSKMLPPLIEKWKNRKSEQQKK